MCTFLDSLTSLFSVVIIACFSLEINTKFNKNYNLLTLKKIWTHRPKMYTYLTFLAPPFGWVGKRRVVANSRVDVAVSCGQGKRFQQGREPLLFFFICFSPLSAHPD